LASVAVFRRAARGKKVIHVQKKRQPKGFKRLVSDPGKVFLAKKPSPSSRDYKGHDYWTRAADELYEAYGGICAFSCHFIAKDTGFRTVEHFKSKVAYPQYAYSWNNYRLVCGLLNGRKGEHEDVLDPFIVKDGWFVLEFPETIIKASDNLSKRTWQKVDDTIKRLRLNTDESCVDSRQRWLDAYCRFAPSDERNAFLYLKEHAPFLANELDRQGLRGNAIIDRRSPVI
jgi:hypothetical protein